jgi:deoxycytidine triphosphate deaminase
MAIVPPVPLSTWRDPGPPTHSLHWRDPDPGTRGMLSAELIERFALGDALMIQPFDHNGLKNSAYHLTVGPWYQVEGTDGILTQENPRFVIGKNAIAFVSVGERLRLPHYIAARFNLKIELVYRGLLLGTGPQVDPGFQGILSFPLHNLSNNPIEITLGSEIATIDFVKTTGLPRVLPLDAIQSEDQLYQEAGQRSLPLFPRDKRWLKPINEYQPIGVPIRSSIRGTVRELEGKVKELDKTVTRVERVDRWTIVGVGVAVVASVVAFAAINWSIFQSQQGLAHDGETMRTQIGRLQNAQAASAQQQQLIRACLSALASANPARPSPLPSSCSP